MYIVHVYILIMNAVSVVGLYAVMCAVVLLCQTCHTVGVHKAIAFECQSLSPAAKQKYPSLSALLKHATLI